MKDRFIVERIITCVSNAYNLTPDELKARKQTSELVEARQMAYYIIRLNTDTTLETIGRMLGNFRPASVYHGFMRMVDLTKSDPDINDKYRDIVSEVNHVAS